MDANKHNATRIAKDLRWTTTFNFDGEAKTFHQLLPPAGVRAVAQAIMEAEERGRASVSAGRISTSRRFAGQSRCIAVAGQA